jgi:hypothetical protein
VTATHLHGMTPCDARPYTEPPFACFSPGPDAVCSECGCGFAPREWRPAMSGVVGLYPEGVAS